MNRKHIKKGGTYNYSTGTGSVRTVVVLDTTPQKATGAKTKACLIPVKFLDDDTEGLVGTKGIRHIERIEDKSAPQNVKGVAAPSSDPVILCFTVEFRVAAQNAGLIQDVLELLKGQGAADVIGVKTINGN